MELKLLTDLIDALGKVAGGMEVIVNLTKAERKTIRGTLDEPYHLIDTTLNMVIMRLGDSQLQASNDELLSEVARLDNYNQRMQAEREFRLCRSLHVALSETETLAGRLAGAMSAKGWDRCYRRCTPFSLPKAKLRCSSGRSFRNLKRLPAAVVSWKCTSLLACWVRLLHVT